MGFFDKFKKKTQGFTSQTVSLGKSHAVKSLKGDIKKAKSDLKKNKSKMSKSEIIQLKQDIKQAELMIKTKRFQNKLEAKKQTLAKLQKPKGGKIGREVGSIVDILGGEGKTVLDDPFGSGLLTEKNNKKSSRNKDPTGLNLASDDFGLL